MKIIQNYIQIYDNIHGYIKLTNWASIIISNKYFQRLRELKQLGICHYVFPNAIHTRFEHSIGAYHLAGKLLERIAMDSDKKHINECLEQIPQLRTYCLGLESLENELFLDEYVIELIKISALCHDLGHGPFSHLFDDVYLTTKDDFSKHEYRSCLIMEKIIKESILDIYDEHIEFMKTLINPTKEHAGFVYQIVSNNLNGMDVDKYDYITRDTYNVGVKYSFDFTKMINDVYVINNNICYPEKIFYEIACMFMTRYRLHKQIYNHKAVLEHQYMIKDIMVLMNDTLKISKNIYNVDEFIDYTDSYILSTLKYIYKHFKNTNIIKAHDIFEDIQNRYLYKLIGSVTTHEKKEIKVEDIKKFNAKLNENNIIIHNLKIGLVSGDNPNPLDNIYFYNKTISRTFPTKCFKIDKTKITTFLPDKYQEYIIMIFMRNICIKDDDIVNQYLKTII